MALPLLYIDEDSCGRRLVAGLRRLGFDVLTVDEAKTRRWSDEQQLQFATSAGRLVVSANVGDFARLQQAWGRRAAIISESSFGNARAGHRRDSRNISRAW